MGGLREIMRASPDGRGVQRALEFSCARCEATFAHRPVHSGTDEDREHEVMTAAKRAGWATLKGPRKSFCPACVARAAATKARAQQETKTMVVTRKPAAVAAPVPETAKAEAPPVLDVTAALIIQRKLADVYLDGARGYDGGWTDKRLAETLGVPRAHVREVRRLVYGQDAAGDGEDVREVLGEARALLDAAKALHLAAVKVESGHAELQRLLIDHKNRHDRLERRIAEIEKAVS